MGDRATAASCELGDILPTSDTLADDRQNLLRQVLGVVSQEESSRPSIFLAQLREATLLVPVPMSSERPKSL